MGVWQLESRSRTTFSDLKGLFRLCRALGVPSAFGLPVTLRIEIVSSRSPETGQAREFPLFRFFPRVSYNEALGRIRAFRAAVSPAQLPPPDDSTPPLGAALDADQEALSCAAPMAGPPHSNSVDLQSLAAMRAGGPAASLPEAARPRHMPLPEFRELAHQAATVLGTKGSTPGKAWLLEHYGIPNPAGLSDEQYEDAIRRLREIVNGSGSHGEHRGPAATVESQPVARQPARDR